MTGGAIRRLSVFISHSGADRAWAARLAHALAGLRVPAGYDGGSASAVRFAPILPGDAAEDGPEGADRLVVVCSPRAAISDLVDGEARAFGRTGLTALLIVDGEPGAGRHADLAHQECLPPSLRGAAACVSADPRPDRDGWPGAATIIAAGLLGVAPRALARALARRRRRSWIWRVTAAAGVLAGVGLGLLAMEERKGVAATERLRAAALTTLDLLDDGREEDALRAFAAAAPDIEPDAPADLTGDMVWPAEARLAATRLALEARLLADIPAPVSRVSALSFLPDGALAVTGRRGRVYLVDPAVGARLAVYAPAGRAYERIAPDGRTLWSARREPARSDAANGAYSPLVFEDVALESGAVRVRAAVQSPPGEAGAGAISTDGALFAVDLGPGEAEDTVIAAFSRHRQELAGVLKLPSDRADLHFLGPDLLLARIDPPGATGVYLWRVGAARPLTLRAPGEETGCGAAAGRAALAAAADGTEVAMLTALAGGGACLERWTSADGALLGAAKASQMKGVAAGIAVAAADGPYLIWGDGADGRLIDAAGVVVGEAPGCGGARLIAVPSDGPSLIACAARGAGTMIFNAGRGGGEVWRGRFGAGEVDAFAFDPTRRMLATAGRDGRLRFWDAAPRGRALNGLGAARRLIVADGRVAALGDDAARVYTAAGAPVGPVIAAPGAREAVWSSGRLGLFSEDEGRGAFTIHNPQSGETLALYDGLAPYSAQGRIAAGGRAALLGADGAVRLIGMTDAAALAQVAPPKGRIVALEAHAAGFAMLTQSGARLALFAGAADGSLDQVADWPASGGALRVARDGEAALVTLNEGGAFLVDLANGAARAVPAHDDAALSPDGAWLVLRRGLSATAISRAEGAEYKLSPTARGPVLFGRGGLIAVGGAPPVLARSDAPPLCPDALRISASPRAFSPDGGLVAFETRRGVVALDLATCRIARATGTLAAGRALAMPDNRRLWIGAGDGAVVLPLSTTPGAALAGVRRRAGSLPTDE